MASSCSRGLGLRWLGSRELRQPKYQAARSTGTRQKRTHRSAILLWSSHSRGSPWPRWSRRRKACLRCNCRVGRSSPEAAARSWSTVRLIWLPQPRSTTGSGPRILGRTARRHARRSDGLHQRLPRTIEGLSEHCSYGLVTAPYGHASRLHSLLLYSGVSASGRVGALTGALRQMLLFVSHPAIPPTREWTDSRAMRTPSGCVPSGSRRHSP